MTNRGAVARTRSHVLQVAFGLLYSRLAFLHELVGRAAYGPSWDGRRRHVVPDSPAGVILDIGCGEGRLLATLPQNSITAIGVEPSAVMASKARSRGVNIVRASAQALPVASKSVAHILATYPGPWLIDSSTWDEFTRVLVPGGTVTVLIGGTITRGHGARIRRLLLRLAYGGDEVSIEHAPPIGHPQIIGEYALVEDEWGQAIIWSGTRHEQQQGDTGLRGWR